MMLLVDFRTDGARMAAVPVRGGAVWVAARGRDAGIGLFARLERTVPRLRSQLRMVVLAGGTTNRAVTWSSVRAGVAFANSLAFALGIPAISMTADDTWTREHMEAAARTTATRRHQPRARIRASYVGEPNITSPKA